MDSLKKNGPIILILLLTLIPRFLMFPFESGDYTSNLSLWYDQLKTEGFQSLKTGFHDYTPPYLYLLYLVGFLGLPKLYAIKLIGLLSDYLLTVSVFLLVKEKHGKKPGFMAAILALYLPTVLINASLWGQCDSLYTAFLLLALHQWMKNQDRRAMLFWGIAFALKIQSVFLLLVPAALLAKKQMSWKEIVWVPLIYLIAILPNWLAGRPFLDLLGIYLHQSGEHTGLSSFAPNVYQWLSWAPNELFTQIGIGFVGSVCGLFFLFMIYHKAELKKERILQIALFSALFIPFFLPRMHERYFFLADILSLVYAFYFPRKWYLPLLIVSASFFSYLYFLFSTLIVFPFSILAALNALALILVGKDLFQTLVLDDGSISDSQSTL
ncbi:MAG: hypothetical protein GC180_01020 [Bacteroidetes bacterium]|nr:hypothetical protein [Bacteroidota bacterium]